MAILVGVVPVVAAVFSLVMLATDGERRNAPSTFNTSNVEGIGLLLFFIGAPAGGLISILYAVSNSRNHGGPDGTEQGRTLSFFAIASTLIGWGPCALQLAYVMVMYPRHR